MHPKTFERLQPSPAQEDAMQQLGEATESFVSLIEAIVPGGADRTHAVRLVRTAGMWLSQAVLRDADGTPRETAT